MLCLACTPYQDVLDLQSQVVVQHTLLIQSCHLERHSCKQYANGFKSCHRRKCFIEVNPFNLSVALSNQTSLVSDNLTMFILFFVIDPFGANDVVLLRVRTLNQFPHIVQLKLLKLFLHRLNPFRFHKGFSNFLGF